MPASCSKAATRSVMYPWAMPLRVTAMPGRAKRDLGWLDFDRAIVHQRLRSGVLCLAWPARIGAGAARSVRHRGARAVAQ